MGSSSAGVTRMSVMTERMNSGGSGLIASMRCSACVRRAVQEGVQQCLVSPSKREG